MAYIAARNPDAADRLQSWLEEAIEQLTVHLEVGRPGRVDGTRELVVSGTNYIVPYRVRARHVEVVAILHASREWPADFD